MDGAEAVRSPSIEESIMAHILFPLPSHDFDPTEVGVTWRVLTAAGHGVSFATPDGKAGAADPIMITGRGLDPWSPIPLIGRITVIGRMLRANKDARRAYAEMIASPAFRSPRRWDELSVDGHDAIVLGGGHRARGMREYLESPVLQKLVADFFAADKPVAAICHGVLLAARSKRADGRSVLHGRKTTALSWRHERTASAFAHVGRFWDRNYYRTYPEEDGQPKGYMSVEQEVIRHLADPGDFIDVRPEDPHFRRKTSGLVRDSFMDHSPALVVEDGNYVSARWPGDTHCFASTFARLLSRSPAEEDARRARVA
ncbi:thiJ/pfpI-family protein [Sphingobium indicum IP26]|nr:thiJ/pfpI-family protein [Sphingobium indicum IP26]EQB03021.1 thiJ/pfpI-family protein [Sphingobium sp. HDIP04]